jgi:HAD superfamily hydrolase (TIGR01458 family)
MVDGLLLDMDGVLAQSFAPMPGAAETLAWIRDRGLPFRIVTNTTTHSRSALAATLRSGGLDLDAGEIVTAVTGTAAYLEAHHPGARVLVLSDGNAREDLDGVNVTGPDEPADVVVLGGASDDFTYAALNRIFRLLMDGAVLVGMHRNLYWRTDDGLELDGGAYIAGLEAAAGVSAAICGKPSPAFFDSALRVLGLIVNDVLGAQTCGLTGVLVRTGKFMEGDLAKGVADHVVDSIAELPELLSR